MHFDRDTVVAFALQLLEEGADIVDVGESRHGPEPGFWHPRRTN
jgi:hypothetical protein